MAVGAGVSIETLRFLRDLVGSQQIAANHPDLIAVATLIRDVRDELDRAIEEAQ